MSKCMNVHYKKQCNKGMRHSKPLITHRHELGFLIHVCIHIFAACWESGAVAFANVHLCAICFYCIM